MGIQRPGRTIDNFVARYMIAKRIWQDYYLSEKKARLYQLFDGVAIIKGRNNYHPLLFRIVETKTSFQQLKQDIEYWCRTKEVKDAWLLFSDRHTISFFNVANNTEVEIQVNDYAKI